MSNFYNILVQIVWAAVKHTEERVLLLLLMLFLSFEVKVFLKTSDWCKQDVVLLRGHKGAIWVYIQNFNCDLGSA